MNNYLWSQHLLLHSHHLLLLFLLLLTKRLVLVHLPLLILFLVVIVITLSVKSLPDYPPEDPLPPIALGLRVTGIGNMSETSH